MNIQKFKKSDYSWEHVERLVYKEDGSPFKDVTRQVLFDGAFDLSCQLRYFEIGAGGYSTLEHHEHTHFVMIFRGAGECLVGHTVYAVNEGDTILIPSHAMHQFRANRGEPLGFLCLVNKDRDKVKLPTEEEMTELLSHKDIGRFLKGDDAS